MAFIISKRNFLVHLAGGEKYRIPKDYMGHIPEDVYNNHLVQKNIEAGLILVPASTSDKDIQKAADKAEEKTEEQPEEKTEEQAETKKKSTSKK